MKNYILKILIKPVSERTIGELATLTRFWAECSTWELGYAVKINNLFK